MQLEYIKGVVSLQLDEGKCVGCGMCIEVCPHDVFAMNGTKTVSIENRDACIECGACSMNCPAEAISVEVGVGCAAAVINSLLGREASACCCSLTPQAENSEKKTSCC